MFFRRPSCTKEHTEDLNYSELRSRYWKEELRHHIESSGKKIHWADIRDRVLEEARAIHRDFDGDMFNEPVTIVEGITEVYINNSTPGGRALAQEFIPMIMLVGEKTNLVHFMALKALLPDLDV
jgi:hypothetical protein